MRQIPATSVESDAFSKDLKTYLEAEPDDCFEAADFLSEVS
jgi:hypothetical protein